MSHPIASCIQTLSCQYKLTSAALGFTALFLEAMMYRFFRVEDPRTVMILCCKHVQMMHPIGLIITTYSPVKGAVPLLTEIGIQGAFFLSHCVSHTVSRTDQNQLMHRAVCVVSHAINITAKALNIIGTCALLRQYSQAAMIVGGIAMTILSGMSLRSDWQELSLMRKDQVTA